MKVLVVGGGGREHAIIWKIAQSRHVDKIYCAPGNAGTALIAENISISATDVKGLLKFARENKIDLTVVGPEVSLAEGLNDTFSEAGLKVFGPKKAAAQLESSKIYSKEFMAKYNIPTADFKLFDNHQDAIDYLSKSLFPIVIKADGLAAGKGVIIAENFEQAKLAVEQIMVEKVFGEAGDKIIIEECLKGEEASILAFTDGTTIIPMVSSQDHKRIFEADKGPNTGGMGAYSPAPIVDDPAFFEKINDLVFKPFINGLKEEGLDYHGVIYAGLMIDNGNMSVLEFNVRFGDPETQAVLPRLKTDLFEVMNTVVENRLHEIELEWYDEHAICVVIASGGYPGSYEKGKEIKGLNTLSEKDGVIIFHAGTALNDGKVFTSGGRVLGITGMGKTLKEAQEKAYSGIEKINFDDMVYRKDIGYKALSESRVQITE